MIDINEADFRRLDLNLLLVFSALLRERSVTKAARRLFLGQPALSAALGRLRAFAGDELFVRTAAGMEPTARALQWAAALKPVLEGLNGALFAGSGFDPATSERSFTLGMFDILELVLAPRLLATLAEQAPGVRLAIVPADRNDAGARLDDGTLELAIANIGEPTGWQRRETLFDEHFVCVFDPRRVQADVPITLDQYLAVPHVLTSFGGSFWGLVDDALAEQGLARRVVFVTRRFATLPFVLGDCNAIATLPATAACMLAARLGLTVSPLPILVPAQRMSMLWHARSHDDAGHVWLRQLVARTLTAAVAPLP